MKHLKSFESMFKVDKTELEKQYDRYYCQNCHSTYETYKPKNIVCKFCLSKDVILIDSVDKI